MTLDGKLATRTGDSRWISGAAARAIVHRDPRPRRRDPGRPRHRGRRRSAADRPTRRPARWQLAIVLDEHAALSTESKLARTAQQVPVIVACGPRVAGKPLPSWPTAAARFWSARARIAQRAAGVAARRAWAGGG